MKHYVLGVMGCAILAGNAFAAIEPNYDPSKPPVTTPWFAMQDAAEREADLNFITGMRPHHAGALTMSEEYLGDAGASHGPLMALARGIIHNQKFEIAMLDRVEELVGKPLANDPEWRQIAERGLAQKQRFVRAPMPAGFGGAAVSRRDVEFAKAMVIHHEGALMMCNDYLADRAATNKYLRLLCVDILTDQKMEIDYMNRVVARYPGNPDEVVIDASMIHGMEGMEHHMHGVAPASKKVGKPAKDAATGGAHSGHGSGHGAAGSQGAQHGGHRGHH